jgi:hypothetical protein
LLCVPPFTRLDSNKPLTPFLRVGIVRSPYNDGSKSLLSSPFSSDYFAAFYDPTAAAPVTLPLRQQPQGFQQLTVTPTAIPASDSLPKVDHFDAVFSASMAQQRNSTSLFSDLGGGGPPFAFEDGMSKDMHCMTAHPPVPTDGFFAVSLSPSHVHGSSLAGSVQSFGQAPGSGVGSSGTGSQVSPGELGLDLAAIQSDRGSMQSNISSRSLDSGSGFISVSAVASQSGRSSESGSLSSGISPLSTMFDELPTSAGGRHGNLDVDGTNGLTRQELYGLRGPSMISPHRQQLFVNPETTSIATYSHTLPKQRVASVLAAPSSNCYNSHDAHASSSPSRTSAQVQSARPPSTTISNTNTNAVPLPRAYMRPNAIRSSQACIACRRRKVRCVVPLNADASSATGPSSARNNNANPNGEDGAENEDVAMMTEGPNGEMVEAKLGKKSCQRCTKMHLDCLWAEERRGKGGGSFTHSHSRNGPTGHNRGASSVVQRPPVKLFPGLAPTSLAIISPADEPDAGVEASSRGWAGAGTAGLLASNDRFVRLDSFPRAHVPFFCSSLFLVNRRLLRLVLRLFNKRWPSAMRAPAVPCSDNSTIPGLPSQTPLWLISILKRPRLFL